MKNLYIGVIYLLSTPLYASEVDCRNLSTKVTSECNTYGVKLLYNKKLNDPKNRKKLITSKTLPVPQKKRVKIITVDKLIEEHIKINEPIRYSKEYGAKKIEYIDENQTKALNKVKSDKNTTTVANKKTQKVTSKSTKEVVQKRAEKKDKLVELIKNWNKSKSTTPKKTQKVYTKKAPTKPKKKQVAKKKKYKFLKRTFNNKLRVLATAYTSHRKQTDRTPFLAAWNNRIRPGMKIIAVSRDLIRKHGLRNGSKVRISGLKGTYVVRDKMNKRYRNKIDIYMGTNRRRALRWGRRYVTLYW